MTPWQRLRRWWRWAVRDFKRTFEVPVVVELRGLTEAQRIALEDLLATWQQAGSLGCSRWTAFYADGDGNFRPRITIDGRAPRHTDLLPAGSLWTGGAGWRGEYRIDFDKIAWRLHHEPQGDQRPAS